MSTKKPNQQLSKGIFFYAISCKKKTGRCLLFADHPSTKADVKPNCEWLKGKLVQREANREAESQSLKEAVKLIKAS